MAALSILAIVVMGVLQTAQALSYGLTPGTNISRKLNYTLFDESESKKIILELWVDRVPKEEKKGRLLSGGGEHDLNTDLVKRFNGAVYLINQDLFSQDNNGRLDYTIDIGFHDKTTETDLTYNDGSRDNTKKVSPRDWLTFTFHLDNKDAKNGKWACIDGFSDYAKKYEINLGMIKIIFNYSDYFHFKIISFYTNSQTMSKLKINANFLKTNPISTLSLATPG